jgi:hypothetical protein
VHWRDFCGDAKGNAQPDSHRSCSAEYQYLAGPGATESEG